MKFLVKNIILLGILGLFIFGCSNNASRSHYFGYDNNPKVVEEEQVIVYNDNENDENWSNPLGSNNYNNNYDDVVYQTNGLRYQEPMYVPVIVPWWSSYYGWMNPYRRSFLYVDYHYSYNHHCGYDWYSPWYHYHPYYGGYYDDWYRPHYRWYDYGYNSRNRDVPDKKESYRNFGANRGTYTVAGKPNTNTDSPRGSVINNTNSNRNSNTIRTNTNSNNNTNSGRTIYTDSPRNSIKDNQTSDKPANTNLNPRNDTQQSKPTNDGAIRGNSNNRTDSPRNSTPSYTPPARNNEPSNSRPASNDTQRGSNRNDNSKSGSSSDSPRRTR